MKRMTWGLLCLALAGAGGLSGPLCASLFKDRGALCLVPYTVCEMAAAVCGVVAAVRGDKWWIAASALCGALAVQGISVFMEIAR